MNTMHNVKLPIHVQILGFKLRKFWDVDDGQRETYNAGRRVRKILHYL